MEYDLRLRLRPVLRLVGWLVLLQNTSVVLLQTGSELPAE